MVSFSSQRTSPRVARCVGSAKRNITVHTSTRYSVFKRTVGNQGEPTEACLHDTYSKCCTPRLKRSKRSPNNRTSRHLSSSWFSSYVPRQAPSTSRLRDSTSKTEHLQTTSGQNRQSPRHSGFRMGTYQSAAIV